MLPGFLCFLAFLTQATNSNGECAPLGRVHRSEKLDDGMYSSFRESVASVSAPIHGDPNRLSASTLKDRIAHSRLLSFCEPMRLHRLSQGLFQRIQEEISQIMTTSSGANVLSEKHPIAWVKAFGEAKSFSLITASGVLNDTSDLLNFDTRQKRFSQADKYPALADFIELFPHTTNWRINVLGPSDSCDGKGSGFSPHRAFVMHEVADEEGNAKTAFRMKFHLPVFAQTELVDMQQHDQSYEFELGDVYYFTNGCRHAVENRAAVPRVHIIWDMLLTEDTFERMLGEGADLDKNVARMRSTADRTVSSKGKWTTTDVEQEPEKTWATMQVFFNDLVDVSPPKECRIAIEDAHLLSAPEDISDKEALVRSCRADWALVSHWSQDKTKHANITHSNQTCLTNCPKSSAYEACLSKGHCEIQ